MSATEPVVVTRTRHENGSSLSSAKTRELIFSAGAIGIGALGGYYAVDYLIRTQAIEKFLARIGITFGENGNTGGNTEPVPEDKEEAEADKQANFAHIVEDPRRPSDIFDRTTRVNSYAARQTQSYAVPRLFNRKPTPVVEGGIDITQFQVGIPEADTLNQVVTDDYVYDSF